tara:strand:+ start:334 stop:1131 length:798 start_codon:yes stop_codon:yes gene_type:complete
MEKKVSIITVSNNSVKTIAETIESVKNQTYKNIEYIVIDNCSKDGTIEVLEKYKKYIGKLIIEPDKGIYDAMNKGIRNSSGEVIGILNSDDFYKDKFVIESIMENFDRDHTLEAVLSDIYFFKESSTHHRIVRKVTAQSFKPWKLRFGWMPPHPGIFLKKETQKEVGYYKTDYQIASDFEFCLRLFFNRQTSYSISNICSVLMREGGISTKSYKNNFLISSEIIRACRENNIYTNFIFIFSRLPIKMALKIKDYFLRLRISKDID